MRPTAWLAERLRRRPPQGEAAGGGAAPDEVHVAYDGVCTLCGTVGPFETTGIRRSGKSFRCSHCNAALRARNEAAAILEEIGRGRHLCLKEAVGDDAIRALAVYNVGSSGPTRRWLSELPDYTESRYTEGVPLGPAPDGTRNEDLQALTFADGRFDLVTSSHVMEHVADPARAFREIHRVLRPGGRYVFSVPIRWPPPDVSVVRCAIVDGELVHYRNPAYHGSPSGEPTLVFTDFGTDLLDMLEGIGFQARHSRPHLCVDVAYRDSLFVATKAAAR
jgi:SAM-dependent methyltransferase